MAYTATPNDHNARESSPGDPFRMAKPRHLTHAPIREAVIDIQFQAATNQQDVASFAQQYADGRGRLHDLWAASLEVRVGASGIEQARTGTQIGKRLDFDDGQHVAQFRVNGFAFSRLAPYETWESMNESASGAWAEYSSAIQPREVNRIALRYINSLCIPLPVDAVESYLPYGPRLPPELPQVISGFLSRVQINDVVTGDFTVVTQMAESVTPDGAGLNVLFDIDVSHPCSLAWGGDDQISEVLSRLRELKNKAFFGFLEEKTLEPYI